MALETDNAIIVGMTGASGAAYAVRLVEVLLSLGRTVHVTATDVARRILAEELEVPAGPAAGMFRHLFPDAGDRLSVHEIGNVGACIASGSFQARGMVVVPCSSGTLARLAGGLSTNLLDRTADVMLKEKRSLLIVMRETPLSLIQLENQVTLARAGATLLPANPGFYLRPRTIQDLVDFVVARILDHLGIEQTLVPRWTGKAPRDAAPTRGEQGA